MHSDRKIVGRLGEGVPARGARSRAATWLGSPKAGGASAGGGSRPSRLAEIAPRLHRDCGGSRPSRLACLAGTGPGTVGEPWNSASRWENGPPMLPPRLSTLKRLSEAREPRAAKRRRGTGVSAPGTSPIPASRAAGCIGSSAGCGRGGCSALGLLGTALGLLGTALGLLGTAPCR